LQYHDAVERFYGFSDANLGPLLDAFTDRLPEAPNESYLAAIARSLGNSFVSPLQPPQLLIDISCLMASSAPQLTNTEPLLSLLRRWLCAYVPGVLIEPIYFANGHHYYARQFAGQLIACPNILTDELIQSAPGDVWLSLHLDPKDVTDAQGTADKSPELEWFVLQGNHMLSLDASARRFFALKGDEIGNLLGNEISPDFWASLGQHSFSQEKITQIQQNCLLQLLSSLGLGTQNHGTAESVC
jgi:hypothetical protein